MLADFQGHVSVLGRVKPDLAERVAHDLIMNLAWGVVFVPHDVPVPG